MDVCYVDTETTSLRNPFTLGGRRTWEVALIRVPEEGGPVAAEWFQILDVDLADADPKSLQLNGFHRRFRPTLSYGETVDIPGETEMRRQHRRVDGIEHPVDVEMPRRLTRRGVSEADAARIIEELTRGAVIAGSNPAFDLLNFADLLYRHGLPGEGWWHHPRDIPNIATGWLLAREQGLGAADPTADSGARGWTGAAYSTKTLSEACGIPEPADRHSAWADAVWMWLWDRKLRGIELPEVSARPKDADAGILAG